jgi:hypothetical protein
MLQGGAALALAPWGPGKTADLKDNTVRIGQGVAMTALDTEPLRAAGHRGMTLSTVQNTRSVIGRRVVLGEATQARA